MKSVRGDPGYRILNKKRRPLLNYVCLMEKIPFLQIRSVSNELGERDKTRWKLSEALLHLNEALIVLIQKLQTVDETLFRI